MGDPKLNSQRVTAKKWLLPIQQIEMVSSGYLQVQSEVTEQQSLPIAIGGEHPS
jgi:hypothetical protein